jgi:hypothetical protein
MNSSGSAEGAAIVVLLSLALVRHRRSMGIEETVTVIHDRNPSHGASPKGSFSGFQWFTILSTSTGCVDTAKRGY